MPLFPYTNPAFISFNYKMLKAENITVNPLLISKFMTVNAINPFSHYFSLEDMQRHEQVTALTQ